MAPLLAEGRRYARRVLHVARCRPMLYRAVVDSGTVVLSSGALIEDCHISSLSITEVREVLDVHVGTAEGNACACGAAFDDHVTHVAQAIVDRFGTALRVMN